MNYGQHWIHLQYQPVRRRRLGYKFDYLFSQKKISDWFKFEFNASSAGFITHNPTQFD